MTSTAGQGNQQQEFKRQAAEWAVQFVQSGMTVGLGTGSTAIFATRRIGELLRRGELKDVVAIATSRQTDDEARQLGIPMIDDSLAARVDITIDGADEVDPELNVIKGGGGALLREKIVAQASSRMIVVVDESKLSDCLGTKFAVPVEVLRFGWMSQQRFLQDLGARVKLRQNGSATYHTDSGNLILDCAFGPILDATPLAQALAARAGIVEHGLFIGLASDLVIAGSSGVRHQQRRRT
jgi:ribose 5-phosphate isomerase A